MRDTLVRIVSQLVRIDNRTDAELARSADLRTARTIAKLRDPNSKISYIRTTTATAIASATMREFAARPRRRR